MSRRVVAPTAVALIAGLALTARAEEPEPEPLVEGRISLGWRFLADSDEGRFPQDHGLQSGPRIFSFDVEGRDLEREAPISEFTASGFGIGDRNTDYRASIRTPDELAVEGGFSRDEYDYRASGDPFPYDIRRDKGHLTLRWKPAKAVSLRLGWVRTTRRGTAYVQSDTDLRGSTNPLPAGVDRDLVFQRRPLDQTYDRFTFAATTSHDAFRFGLTQSFDLGRVDDERLYEVSAARRTGGPISEQLHRRVRSRSMTTVVKAGWTHPEDLLEADVFLTYGRTPLRTRVSGDREGFDDAFKNGGARGQFEGTLDGGNRTTRTHRDLEAEVIWRPHDDLEVIGSGEIERVIDDASLSLDERRIYDRTDVPSRVLRQRVDARISDKSDRWAVELGWDAHDDVRVRVGEEFHRQRVTSPTDSSGLSLLPTVHRSRTQRHLLGVDVKPAKDVSLSALARLADDDRPHSNASAEETDAWVVRARVRASRRVRLTGVFRSTGFENDDRLGSKSRSDAATVSATWSDQDWTVTGSATFQDRDTAASTRFFELTGGQFTRVRQEIRFRARDTILNLHVGHDVTPELRVSVDGTLVDTDGTYRSRYHDIGLTGAWEWRDDLTLSATLRELRLDERDRNVDDYDVAYLEIALTYRF